MTGLESHIRYAGPQDNLFLAEFGARAFYAAFADQNTPENMAAYLASAFSPEKQAAELADTRSAFLILEVNGEAAGYARLLEGPAPEGVSGLRPIELVRIYVDPDLKGRGLGKALLTACLAEAEKRGCDTLWLGVWEHNRNAIGFYQKQGFKQVGSQSFQLGDERQTDWVMQRPISYPDRSV